MMDVRNMAETMRFLRARFAFQDVPMSYICVFFTVAERERFPMAELAEFLNVGRTTVTRAVAYMSAGLKENATVTVGLDLLKSVEDPLDVRRKLVVLTDNGRQVIEDCQKFLDGRLTIADIERKEL